MIILDRAQTLALERAKASSICVQGVEGSGKTTVANAIAAQVAEAGATCLLVGASAALDKPVEYHMPAPCHPILRKRAQVTEDPSADPKSDHLGDRRRLDPVAARLAACVLQRAHELTRTFDFGPDDVELSAMNPQPIAPEVLDMLVIAVHDAGRIARLLWAGDRLSGRTLREVECALAGQRCDVSADGLLLSLILADERAFEKKLTAILKAAHLLHEEERLAAAISALRNPPSPEETVKEVHERTKQMAQMLRGAIALVRQRGGLQKALQTQPRTRATAVIECFVRDHPSAKAEAAIRLFAKLADQCDQDRAALDSYLERHGTQDVASVAKLKAGTLRLPSDRVTVASYVQSIREARYASRQLRELMERLVQALSPPVLDEIVHLPLDKVVERIEIERSPDHRTMAANEMRHLREVFVSTGYGNLFSVSEQLLEGSFAEPAPQLISKRHGPALLDLLLDQSVLTVSTKQPAPQKWPSSIVRARTNGDLAEITIRGDRFDVVVVDDADSFDHALLEHFASAASQLHRLGKTKEYSEPILFEISHCQVDPELAEPASAQQGFWLAETGGLGLAVHEPTVAAFGALPTEAQQLVPCLQNADRNAAEAPIPDHVDVAIAAGTVNGLRDVAREGLAGYSREELGVLCHSDFRQPRTFPRRVLSVDAAAAQSLGWQLRRSRVEGVVLEKDGRAVVLVDEPIASKESDDLVSNVVLRLSALGWRPLVSWRNAPRDAAGLAVLLDAHAISVVAENSLRSSLEHSDPVSSAPRSDTQNGTQSENSDGLAHAATSIASYQGVRAKQEEVLVAVKTSDSLGSANASIDPAAGAAALYQLASPVSDVRCPEPLNCATRPILEETDATTCDVEIISPIISISGDGVLLALNGSSRQPSIESSF